MTIEQTTASYRDLHDAIERLPEGRRAEVRSLAEKAMGYVWGWEDGGGAERGENDSWNFSILYGWHAYRYAAEESSSRRNIRDCFEAYRRGESF